MNINPTRYRVNEEPIYIGHYTTILSGFDEKEKRAIVIKLLSNKYPSLDEIARFKHEYKISKIFENSKNIIHVYDLEKWDNNYAIVMENILAPSLAEILAQERRIKLADFFELSVNIAGALGQIHQKQIIHKDINVNNIICNLKSKEITIIDFGLAASLPKERVEIINPNILEGTLAYISPEQTGRMNRGIDYRTDYYSLGVTFYQMLTGVLPFSSKDPMELIHCHIAVTPKSPHEILETIPKVVSDIIMKLMTKTAEERYQNINGLIADLKRCQDQLLVTGTIKPFPLGTQDVFSQFQIPEKLYGREKEKNILMQLFEQVAQGASALMLVAGYSGIGKSALVHEIYKPIVKKRGYFISGKFDQFKRSIPYSAFAEAFDKLIEQILTETEETIASFKTKILDAVGQNGRLILEVIPKLVLIIGEQPPITKLHPTESMNRFGYVFQNFISSLTSADHPLVIFLDDLQWADLPSLKMLETLLTGFNCHHLLIIGAYRNNEVAPTHPLMSTLSYLQNEEVICETIALTPLTIHDVNELLADTLYRQQETTLPLAELCYVKTGGNPFFLTQLLLSLYKEHLIEFDPKSNRWTWQIEKIQSIQISDNIVELLVKNIQELSTETQKLLPLAACIGSHFQLRILANLLGKTEDETRFDLQETLKKGYILSQGEAYLADTFYFAHDRIQQAAFSMMGEDEQKMTHINLARLLIDITPEDKMSEMLFNIVNHYNQGLDPIIHPAIDPLSKQKIAELNLQASKLALSASAFEPALRFIEYGLKSVDERAWDFDYSFMLELYNTATKASSLNSEYELTNYYAQTALKHTKNILDEINIIQILIAFNTNQQEAIELALNTINRLGVKIPRNPNRSDVLKVYLKSKYFLMGKQNTELLNLKNVTNIYIDKVIKLISSIFNPTLETNPNLFAYLACKSVILSIQFGHTKGSAYGYIAYGLLLFSLSGNIESISSFFELGLKLVEKQNDSENKVNIQFISLVFNNHWKNSTRTQPPEFMRCFETSLYSGAFETGCLSLAISFALKVFCGFNLKELLLEIEKYASIPHKLNQNVATVLLSSYQQTVINLIEIRESPDILVGRAFNELEIIPKLISANDKTSTLSIYVQKIMLSYIFGRHLDCMAYITTSLLYLEGGVGSSLLPPYYFFQGLNLLAIYPSSPFLEKLKIAFQIKSIINKFDYWTKYAPQNQLHRSLLLKAEWARINGQNEQAARLYDEAITSARQNEFINEEAIARELTAKYYLEISKEEIAAHYMKEAHYCYLLWGADAKVDQLEKLYPYLLTTKQRQVLLVPGGESVRTSTQKKEIDDSTKVTGSGTSISERLDLQTVQKSSQIIASTIILEDLLKNLMHIVIENAGAQKGYLLLSKDEKFVIEAEGNANAEKVDILQSIPITDELLPRSIINYVIHSKQTIVLDNINNSELYSRDPYVLKMHPKSVLCMPLLNQGILTGILYMENNLISGAFTDDRISTLNLLSSQIAISIKNARLYNQIKELYDRLLVLNAAYERFVPEDFLSLLHKKSIVEVKLGDHTQIVMSILFLDLRDFTAKSEKMTPQENFDFINRFLAIMVPIIKKHHGFVDKYIGDAIMALFPQEADDAIQCAIDMLNSVEEYNNNNPQQEPIKIGIGINTGLLMLGIVGEKDRISATVISDSVNIASRMENLTKEYKSPILITADTYKKIKNPARYQIEIVDQVMVKGKTSKITIYKVIGYSR